MPGRQDEFKVQPPGACELGREYMLHVVCLPPVEVQKHGPGGPGLVMFTACAPGHARVLVGCPPLDPCLCAVPSSLHVEAAPACGMLWKPQQCTELPGKASMLCWLPLCSALTAEGLGCISPSVEAVLA